jgi:uncharacterized membrane protein
MKELFRSIRTHILIGGILITPIGVTLWVLLMLVNLLTSSRMSQWLVSPVIRHMPGREITAVQALVSLAVVLSVLFVVGVIFRNLLGRRAYRILDKLMERTPLINKIYMFVRTVSESIVSQKETMFSEVVMIDYPRPGLKAIAFISTRVPPAMSLKAGLIEEPHVYVFLPTTPNPTSGFLLLVPESQITRLDMSSTDAMRLIVSAGAAGPGHGDEGQVPSLLEKLEHMLESRRLAGLRPTPEPNANLNLTDTDDG